MASCAVEGEACSEGCVGASPQENEESGDDSDETHEPIPAVGVHHEIGVDNDNRRYGDVDAESLVVVNAATFLGHEVANAEEQVGEVEADDTLVQAINHVDPELELRPFLSLNTTAVQLWHGDRNFVVHVLIKDTHEDDQERGESQVVEQNVGVIKGVRAVEVGVDLVPEKGEGPHNVLIICQYNSKRQVYL